jgi:hypothetical protein
MVSLGWRDAIWKSSSYCTADKAAVDADVAGVTLLKHFEQSCLIAVSVGAGLPAKAEFQPLKMLDVMASSQASLLPQDVVCLLHATFPAQWAHTKSNPAPEPGATQQYDDPRQAVRGLVG